MSNHDRPLLGSGDVFENAMQQAQQDPPEAPEADVGNGNNGVRRRITVRPASAPRGRPRTLPPQPEESAEQLNELLRNSFGDPDLDLLNNPDMSSLSEPPLLGGRGRPAEIFGDSAETVGRMTSPKLYAQAAQFPTAVQFRVWRWENGVPVALGAIDAEATEEDFVRQFYTAMPEEGDGRMQYRLRPVDIRGQELGKEFTINISEHHESLVRMRHKKKRLIEEREQAASGLNFGGGMNGGNREPVVINNSLPSSNDANNYMAEEMGRMFEQAVTSAERRTEVLQQTLEDERSRLRNEEIRRAEERVSMASKSAEMVQQMTERLMAADRQRANEQILAQKEQSSLVTSTLTTVFQQQQEAARLQAERLRETDQKRMDQDREYFERQRKEAEEQRLREREEWERKQAYERDRLANEQKRMEDQRKYELEQMRMEAERRNAEMERRRQQEKDDMALRMERERMEMDRQKDILREERERWRAELEEKRRTEQQEWERRRIAEKEDAERREREYRERAERERQEFQLRIEREKSELQARQAELERKAQQERDAWERRLALEKQDTERREQMRREELAREENKRREDMQMAQKAMEMQAQRDREHQERMMEMSRLEREAQREAALQREKAEREGREQSEKERQRQYELQKYEMELQKARDREHAERMMQLSKSQNSQGLSGITDLLGMETPELLERIFGGKSEGEAGGGWSAAIPQVLGSIAEIGKAALTARPPAQAQPRAPRLPVAPGPFTHPVAGGDPSHGLPQVAQQVHLPVPAQGPTGLGQVPNGPRRPRPAPVSPPASVNNTPASPEPGVVRMTPEQFDRPSGQGASPQPATATTPAPTQGATAPEATPSSGVAPADVAVETAEEAAKPGEGGNPGLSAELMMRAKISNMKPLDVKKARKAIRTLKEKLLKTPEDQWETEIMGALMGEVNIYHYINAVGLYASMAEAGATQDLAMRLANKLRESDVVPKDLPYTEEDVAAKIKAMRGGAA